MKAKILSILMVLVISVMAIPVVADSPDGGISSVGTLYLDNKNPDTWARVTDNTFGRLNYNSSGITFNFSLMAQNMTASTPYSLIYFADPYPGTASCRLLWTGASDAGGGINVSNSINLGMDLPTAPDANMLVSHALPPDSYLTPLGAKIWLVPAGDFSTTTVGSAGTMTAWNTVNILFETNLILYTDTDKLPTVSGTPLVTVVTTPTASIGLEVSPPTGMNFGSVEIGQCSIAGADRIVTLRNKGTVPIRVTAIPSAGFYTTSLKLGATHETATTLANAWSVVMPVSTTPLLVYARVCPLPGLTGTVTGSVAFMATFNP